jgi:OTU domain-containing protein 5
VASNQQQNQIIHSASSSSNLPEGSNSCANQNDLASNSCVKQTDQNGVDFIKVIEETVSGYNSGDEYLEPKENTLSDEEWKKRDEKFAKSLSERGLIIKEMAEDGACLFRAISYQLYGDQEMHDSIRQQTMDYIYQNREYFEQFLTEDIHSYVKRKRQNHLHGNHIEIQAMSEMYNRPVELYSYEMTPINIYNAEQQNNGYDPLRLSYHRYSHYNAILDPYKSSVGVGLGLAGYRPEDFDPAKQVKDAVKLSEELEIEQMMVEDKLKTTDWEATNDVVVEQIARQSYLQFCKENMSKTLKKSSTSTITSTEASGSSSSILLPCDTSPNDNEEGCSSNQCDGRQGSPQQYVNYYLHTPERSGRRKKRHK